MSSKKPYSLNKIETKVASTKAILCLHGLNQNPKALRPLLQDLSFFGFNAYLLTLPGHDESVDLSQVNHGLYINDYKESYFYLQKIYGDEIYFLGYSFGGLIGVHMLDEIKFKKHILFAPALKLKKYAFAIQWILPFFKKIKSISFFDLETEKKYRFHLKGVPREIYYSFFSIFNEFNLSEKKRLMNTKGLVFCNPNDELVDQKQLWDWINKKTLWEKVSLSNAKAKIKKYNHLCFDKDTLGEESYQSVLIKIKYFLENE